MRKRMIIPGIWFNKDVSKLKLSQRLFYIGLFSIADDEGRLLGDPRYLKAQIFPYDHIPYHAVKSMLQRIADVSLIITYEINGTWYIQHPNWTKHQYIRDKKPSQYPPPPKLTSTSAPHNPNQINTIENKSICVDLLNKFKFNENDIHDWCYIRKQIHRCELSKCEADLKLIQAGVDARKDKIENYDAYLIRSIRNSLLNSRSVFLEQQQLRIKKEA